jgi:hypothetical protein
MNTAQQSSTSSTSDNCSDCNLEDIEKLTCTAKKFGRQAEVMNEVATDLEKYRTQYGAARQKYTDARQAATLDLDTIRESLDDLVEQLRCRLTDRQRQCLEESAEEVFHDIEECSDPYGCQSPCQDTPTANPDLQTDVAALAADIAARRSNLTECAVYFTALVAEPDTITQRIAWLKSQTDDLVKAVGTGGDTAKVVRWYGRWLILDHWSTLDRIGHGFGSVSDYLDCLCGVLKALVSNWTTLATLEGRKAELECFDSAKTAACEKKKDDTLQAILDAFGECEKKDQDETPECEPASARPSTTQHSRG